MKNKQTILAVSILLLIAIVAVLFFVISSGDSKNNYNNNINNSNQIKPGNNSNNLNNEIEKPVSEIDVSDLESVDVETFAKSNNLEVIRAVEIPEEVLEATAEAGSKTVNLKVSETGFSPSEFKVKAGQVITLNLGSIDESAHAFAFVEEGLLSSSVMVTAGYSLGFSFVAPSETGVINFYDEKFPENKGRMIVE